MSFKGKFNVYTCPEGHHTVTFDVDDGVTPMFLGCRYDGTETGCGLTAESACYPDSPLPDILRVKFEQFGWEWYRPSVKWARRKGPETLDHVQRGGLVLRRHEASS
jgi:hypothetical protein